MIKILKTRLLPNTSNRNNADNLLHKILNESLAPVIIQVNDSLYEIDDIKTLENVINAEHTPGNRAEFIILITTKEFKDNDKKTENS